MRISEVIKEFNHTVQEQGYQPVLSGFDEIDGITHGWKPGELCVIGGRPSMGKTAFVLSMIRNLSSSNIPVALFTAVDSPNLPFLSRVACTVLNKEQYWKTEENLKILAESDFASLPVHLYADPKITISFLRNTCKELVEREGVKCIFIETIQALLASESDGMSKDSMEMVCIELKHLAIELNVPIVITSDLNRGPEYRKGFEGKRPKLQDIRLSDAIENIVDSICFILRPSFYRVFEDENGNDLRSKAIIIIEKNKYGACGDAYLTFNYAKCSFEGEKITDIMNAEGKEITDIMNAEGIQALVEALDLEPIQ